MRSFAAIASPLNRFTEKNQQFVWGRDQEEASQKLKNLLTRSPILAFPREGGIVILDSHASESAVEEPFYPKGKVVKKEYWGTIVFPLIAVNVSTV